MHTHGVKVLDRADDDCVVGQVAHHLQFEFLPPEQALFNENLVNRGKRQATIQDFRQFLLVIRGAAPVPPNVKLGRRITG